MKVFTASAIEGSTLCFRKFLSAIDTYQADVGVLLGDLTGRKVVSVIKKGPSSWEVPLDGKVHEIDSPAALAEVTAQIEDHGDYWLEQTADEYEHLRSNPPLVELYFKSLVRERIQEWLALADDRLSAGGPPVFIAPGSGDWRIIDELFEHGGRLLPCDDRIVDVDGYQLVTSSSSGPTEWELAREMDDHDLHKKLLELCSGVDDPDFAIFNLQADSKAAQRIVKRFQPVVRVRGSLTGNGGGVSKAGRTLELSPRSAMVEDAAPALYGVLLKLENGEVQDYLFTEA
jgi:Icc-related predicted phosphoesterase